MVVDLADLKAKNAKRWADAKLTRNFISIARSLVAAKSRYQSVEKRAGVPWFIIAVIHEREASQRWDTQLGQGDPLDKVSVHVPAGRGPFSTWEDGAYDALVNCAPYAAQWKDWTPGGAMTLLTRYNGLGPENHGVASGYVWAGTDQYTKGKYVRDGVWDPNFVDNQPGCAALLMQMMSLDSSIRFSGQIAPQPEVPPPPPAEKPKQTSWVEALLTFIAGLFRNKK